MLSLDGGGIRGVLTLEILGAIEGTLREELKAGDDFVLADYFDYIAGTSSGAIIATGLALGLPVDRLRKLYANNGAQMFSRAAIHKRLRYKYDSNRLKSLLQSVVGDDTILGDDRLRTLLMVVLRNASTDSPWPLSNNPGAKFNDPERPDCNLSMPLWQLVRASTAAPTYFAPEAITVGEQQFLFVDGGITTYLNPSFRLFLMATLEEYGLNWRTGEQNLLLVSVGSGTNPHANENLRPRDMNLHFNAYSIPAALMYASLIEQDMLCRVFGRSRHAPPIDLEVGDLQTGNGILNTRLFTYVRYNAELSERGLSELGVHGVRPQDVQQMDSVKYIGDLQKVGIHAARQVRNDHFEGFSPVWSSAGTA